MNYFYLGRCATVMIMTILWISIIASVVAVSSGAIDDNDDAPTPTASLLRGSILRLLGFDHPAILSSSHDNNNDDGDDGMAALRRLLHSSPPFNSTNYNTTASSSSSSSWSHWHSQWSSLSEADLAAIAYDASSLQKEAHRAWGAAYVSGRRTVFDFENHEGHDDEAAAAAALGGDSALGSSMTTFLRGNNNNDEDDAPPRKLQSAWTMHGTENNNDPIGGLTFANMQENTATAATTIDESEAEVQEMEQRLSQAVKVVQSLNAQHVRYDTNNIYNYSNPNIMNEATSTTNNNTNNNDNMQQFSHTSQSDRQRLLTGSYAAWQWYDRTNLASPTNLKLQKVSRINYAFFQADGNGYVFGTDSWA
eukprot:CAMPEP_0172303034 /NCGR_PEP_ID=MMETSP1058-20130122/4632_1 /TAXON_ID=83371 /ORGANISM="Detonula confervacea, Strain CCMP 353" /LENGTH=363 /DNA_ID=CAMNT_0013013713 /DNA_START=51 /DNA_END=1139 /DNA_ORIENTATION=+